MKVLIAEDDCLWRDLLQSFLEPAADVQTVDDGRKAIEIISESFRQSDPFTIVFLDIQMPERSGHEVLEAIRRLEQEQSLAEKVPCKVIMMTALSDSDNVTESFLGRCDGFLVKPISHKAVNNILRQLGFL